MYSPHLGEAYFWLALARTVIYVIYVQRSRNAYE
jgi:hypothetical protein